MKNHSSYILFSVLFAAVLSGMLQAQTIYEPDWIGSGDLISDGFGWSIGVAGDVNGDGYVDLIVGSPDHADPYPAEEEEGQVTLFYGGPDGLATTPAWSYQSNSYFAVCGFDVSGGDLNGDGYSDLLVGSLIYTGASSKVGRAQLWYGGPDGPAAEPDWEYEGDQFLGLFGSGVSLEADVNGDGYNDLFVAGKNYDSGETDEGKVWMWNGSPDGPVGPVWTFESDDDFAIMGYPINYAGDVNGDGYDDMIMGAAGYTNTLMEQGGAFVFFGGPDGLAETPDWTVYGEAKKDDFGHWVDGAGDVNGDGYDDVIVTAILHESDTLEGNEGAAYVFLGGPTGPSTSFIWKTEGQQLDSNYGYCAAGAGDIDGDGYDDIVVGQKYWTNPEYKEGAAYVYWGTPDGPEPNYCWFAEGGQDSAYMGRHVDGGGDFNNDGYADFLVGAYRMTQILPFDGAVFCMYGGPREADFHFLSDSVCKSDEIFSPVIDGMTGGTFTATGGLSINSATGDIDLSLATVGAYTITYSFDNGFCLVERTHDLLIGAEADATFSYPADTVNAGPGTISATPVAGAGLGVFTAVPEGIVFADASGTVDLALSAPGTYTVTNTYFTGTCYTSYAVELTLVDNCASIPEPFVELVTETTALVSWPPLPAVSYTIYLAHDGDTVIFSGITETSIFLSGLIPGTTYSFWMNQTCASDTSDFSEVMVFTTEGTLIESLLDADIMIYPQPGDDQLTITWNQSLTGEVKISLYDLTGHQIWQEYVPAAEQKAICDTHDYPNGNYLMIINNDIHYQVLHVHIAH